MWRDETVDIFYHINYNLNLTCHYTLINKQARKSVKKKTPKTQKINMDAPLTNAQSKMESNGKKGNNS